MDRSYQLTFWTTLYVDKLSGMGKARMNEDYETPVKEDIDDFAVAYVISGSCDDGSRGIQPAIYSTGIKL